MGQHKGQFVLTGFADEIAVDLDSQLESFKKIGIGYIEIRMVDGKNIVEHTLDEARTIKAKLDAAGIGVSAVGSPIGKVPVTAPFDEYFPVFSHTLDIAEILGTKNIRLFSFYIPEGAAPADFRGEVVRRMAAFVREAERRGFMLLHENEAKIYGETAKCCADLFASVPSENFCAVFDPANFVFAGEEVYPYAYGLLRDKIRYVHVKDASARGGTHEIKPSGEGDGNLRELMSALSASGYSGFLSLEPHLFSMYGKVDIFTAYRQARERGEPTAPFVAEGYAQFMRAYDALAKILDEL